MSIDEANSAEALAAIARDAGVTARVHARRLGGPPGSIGLAPDEPVAIASLYKLPLALVWADVAERGELDPVGPLSLAGVDRLPGPTGVAMLLDDVTVTARDAVRLMLAVSDNAAGDAVLHLLGRDRVHRHLAGLGLPASLVRHGSAEEASAIMRETGTDTRAAAQQALADPGSVARTSQYDAAYASAATAAQLTEVLDVLWSRSGDQHNLVRDAMAHQAWRHRIGAGFPHDDVAIYGKTGTLGRLRHEAAVVSFPHEHPVAVSVLTMASRPELYLPRVDAAIGELARRAVAPLRMPAEE